MIRQNFNADWTVEKGSGDSRISVLGGEKNFHAPAPQIIELHRGVLLHVDRLIFRVEPDRLRLLKYFPCIFHASFPSSFRAPICMRRVTFLLLRAGRYLSRVGLPPRGGLPAVF